MATSPPPAVGPGASFLGIEVPDPSAWGAWTWTLHALGALYVLGFFAAWIRFRGAQAAAQGGGQDAVRRYNASIRGFPWSFYAKMLGRHPYR